MVVYDVIVIGGGVVGCAVLYELSRHGYKCLLLEKDEHLASGASAGNSGMAHTGFDATSGLLETSMLTSCRKIRVDFFTSQPNIPREKVGALMLARNNAELVTLADMRQRAEERGVEGTKLLHADQLHHMEPHLSRDVVGALHIPGEAVVDSWLTPVYMAHLAKSMGSQIQCSNKVTGGVQSSDGKWTLQTQNGSVKCHVVVNAAGLHGDEVENIAQPSAFRIRPRLGEYIVYGKEAGALLNHILLPVPTEKGKGIIVFPSVYGNVVVGPTAVDVEQRANAEVSPAVQRSLESYAQQVLPALRNFKPIGSYAGLRPATDCKDYHLYFNDSRRWVTVGGIRSTGVSACLGIAARVHAMLRDSVTPSSEPQDPTPLSHTTTDRDSVIIDGSEYHITHPLSRFGLRSEKSKL